MASFRKRENGLWEYRISVKKTQPDGTVKYVQKAKGGFKTKKIAERAAYEYQEFLNGNSVDEEMTIARFLDEWITDYVDTPTTSYRPNTIKTFKRGVNIMKQAAGHIKVIDLSPKMYQRIINELLTKYARATVALAHSTIKKAYDHLVIEGEVQRNPVIHAKIDKRADKELVKFLDSSLVPKVLEHLYKEDITRGMFFDTLFETGMRRGEALALTYADIDWNNKTLNVDKSYDTASRTIGKTKNKTSVRVIPVRDEFLERLRTFIKHKMLRRELIGQEVESGAQIFRSDDGTLFNGTILQAMYRRALQKVGHEPLPVHSTRHTHAVMLLEAGVNMKDVQERLGHGSMSSTADIYSHVTTKMKTRTVEMFDVYVRKNAIK